MIDQTSFDELKSNSPFLSDLPANLQDIICGKLTPESNILKIYQVSVNGKSGCLFALEHEMVAYWITKILFKKLPTYQEFNYSQLNEVRSVNDTTLFMHSSANPEVLDRDYEEAKFTFQSATDKEEAMEIASNKAPRLK
jgi:hypothetical protein